MNTVLPLTGFPWSPLSQDKLNGVWGYISIQVQPMNFMPWVKTVPSSTLTVPPGQTTGSPTSEDLYGIWGSSGTDIFAVGDNATIVRYDTENGWD